MRSGWERSAAAGELLSGSGGPGASPITTCPITMCPISTCFRVAKAAGTPGQGGGMWAAPGYKQSAGSAGGSHGGTLTKDAEIF